MTKTFEEGKEEVANLCRYFATNHQAFLAPGVKEDHVRQSLIDPFFEALGWDVHNKARTAPQYQEVIPEDSLDVEGQQKAPDYTFRVGLLPKFYAEAKRCGVNIGADPAPAFQLRRYGWSAKLALSVLTDFEELGVYDCTTRPRPSDKASHARIQYFRFDEYPDRWRELWDVFSREAVWSGAFDQYAASKRKRGTSEVDAEFLKEMEGWRLALAGNIALRNEDLSLDDLNAAVQLTIDRVVFLRMAEDRGLEPYEQLLKVCERPDIYPRFMRDVCRRADEKYNSGLFHFQKESGVSEDPDRITPKLAVDDKVLKSILQSLYFAHGSPYHFGVLPVEILGTVYERFLGKVIRLTAGHQAKVEDKPEVRKAGGVYYTPAYIVEYIVKHTVAKQIEARSPAQLAGEKGKPPFRVLDMACGSGSFLLGAYHCLLDHCLKWYIEHKPENFKKAVYQDPRNGHWRLTIEEKKRILTTHIFGVDIDLQAVEVTKLSLLLKVLEGETDQSLSLSQLAFGDRALPNLADNIKCGNSLIGPDYFTGKLNADPEEMKVVNPFDWKQGFPDAMKAGGFDSIIGNPPYVFARDEGFTEPEKGYFGERYAHQSYQLNTFALFTERGYTLLANGGFLGFIIPNNWLSISTMKVFRDFLVGSTGNLCIVNNLFKVFPGANVDTSLVSFQKRKPNRVTLLEATNPVTVAEVASVDPKVLLTEPIIHIRKPRNEAAQSILARMQKCSSVLEEIALVKAGLKAYETGKGVPPQTDAMKKERIYHSTKRASKAHRKYLDGRDVKRYLIDWSGMYLKYGSNLAAPRSANLFEGERILVRQIPSSLPLAINGAIVSGEELNDINSMIVKSTSSYSNKYILGVINSRLLSLWFDLTFDKFQRAIFPQFKVNELAQFPICNIRFTKKEDKNRHDKMVTLVDSMLGLRKQRAAAKSAAQKAITQRQIDATDAEIDRLVYDLYGLTAEEIALVEGERSQ
jgi:type I restriction-modification system DNA methylase subunit